MVKNKQDRESLKKSIKNYFVKNPNWRKADIVNHFEKQGIARRTVYANINRMTGNQGIQDKKRSGRPTKWTPQKLKNLKRLTNNRKGVVQRKLGLKFGCHQTTISRKLQKMGIKKRCREKAPKSTLEQQEKAKKRCRKLVNQIYKEKCSLILDDEKYFTFVNDKTPGNKYYYSNNKELCPDNVRFKQIEKFPKKILVWVCLSEHGISTPLIRNSKAEAINQTIYLEECLKKRLLPFIREYHQDSNYLFWPDLSTAHYSNANKAWMNEHVNYVPKDSNPPNVPKARPIEDFWGDLTQKVYEGEWEAKNEDHLKKRIGT
jgi:hypothetical protein